MKNDLRKQVAQIRADAAALLERVERLLIELREYNEPPQDVAKTESNGRVIRIV
mgnify:CR=1 FL=1